jgi:hypothetical protein
MNARTHLYSLFTLPVDNVLSGWSHSPTDESPT